MHLHTQVYNIDNIVSLCNKHRYKIQLKTQRIKDLYLPESSAVELVK